MPVSNKRREFSQVAELQTDPKLRIVGVSVACNSQTGNNTKNLFTEYENVTWKVLLLTE
jgi:hypothetical protein